MTEKISDTTRELNNALEQYNNLKHAYEEAMRAVKEKEQQIYVDRQIYDENYKKIIQEKEQIRNYAQQLEFQIQKLLKEKEKSLVVFILINLKLLMISNLLIPHQIKYQYHSLIKSYLRNFIKL